MKDLEVLAKELFQRFALQETGKTADWRYLSKPRQEAWVSDVLLIMDHLLNNLQEDVKPFPIPLSYASYEKGYNQGINSERLKFIGLLEEYRNNFNGQFKDFKDKE